MRKIPAIILLVLFSTMQYGKLISYWNCKITSSNDPRAVQCDCEKILTDTNGDDDANVLTRVQKADKEEFYHANAPAKRRDLNFWITSTIQSASNSFIPSDYTTTIFQPPRP